MPFYGRHEYGRLWPTRGAHGAVAAVVADAAEDEEGGDIDIAKWYCVWVEDWNEEDCPSFPMSAVPDCVIGAYVVSCGGFDVCQNGVGTSGKLTFISGPWETEADCDSLGECPDQPDPDP